MPRSNEYPEVKTFISCIILAAATVAPLGARASAAPIDELQRFAGSWQSQGQFQATPYSKAGAANAKTTCAWSDDHLFMICQQQVTTASGPDDDVSVYSYDDKAGAYRFYNVHPGQVTSTTITVSGDTITYPFSFTENGTTVTIRTLNVWKSAGLYTWRTEYSTDGGNTWTLMASGTSQRR
jgi:hypothetical protein